MPENKVWTLDRRVPLPYLLAILGQTIVFLVVGTSWVTSTNNRLQVLEEFMKNSMKVQTQLANLEQADRFHEHAQNEMRAMIMNLQGQIAQLGRKP